MKKPKKAALLLVLCMLFAFFTANNAALAQGQMLNEKFNYDVGNLLGKGDWTEIIAKTNTIDVQEVPLSYDGYEQTEKSVSLPGQPASRLYKQFSNVDISSGTIYYSFLLKVNSIPGATPFITLGNSATTTQYFARVGVKAEGIDKFKIGVGRAGSVSFSAWSETSYDLSSTILVVVKYTFVDGEKNDVVQLFANPTIGEEPASPTSENGSTGNLDAESLNSVFLYPATGTFSLTAAVNISAIRVATTWADLMGGGAPPSTDPKVSLTDISTPYAVYQYSTSSYKIQVKGSNLKGNVSVSISGADAITIDKVELDKTKLESANGDTITYTISPTASTTPLTSKLTFSTTEMATDVEKDISATVVAVTKKESVAELKTAVTTTTSTVYALENLVVSFAGKEGETYVIYAQDASGGIKISDDNTVFEFLGRTYKIGDKLPMFYGTATPKSMMSQLKFIPEFTDMGDAIEENVSITPVEVTLSDLKANAANYECKLVKITGEVEFYNRETEATNGKFTGPKNFSIRQTPEQTGSFARTLNNTLNDIVVPAKASITGVSTTVGGTVVGLRSPSDIIASEEEPEPPTGTPELIVSVSEPESMYQNSSVTYPIIVKAKNLQGDINVSVVGSTEITLSKAVINKAKAESANGDTLTYTITSTVAAEENTASIKMNTTGLDKDSVYNISWASYKTVIKSSVADLKNGLISDDYTVYVLENLVITSIQKNNLNKITHIYAQDNTGGVLLDETSYTAIDLYKRSFKVGDKFGKLFVNASPSGMSNPTTLMILDDPGVAVENNVTVTPIEITLDDLKKAGKANECMLVKIKGEVEFYKIGTEATTGKFEKGKFYSVRQSEDQTTFRVKVIDENASIAGSEIPAKASITGVSISPAGISVGLRTSSDIIASEPEEPEDPTPAANLFSNGGFEIWGGENAMLNPGGTPEDWTMNMGASSKEETIKTEGNYSLKLTASNRNNQIAQEVGSVVAPEFLSGETYKIKINYYVATGITTGSDISMQSFWKGGGGVGDMEHDKEILNNGIFFTSIGSWASKEFVTTVPQGATKFYFKLFVDKGVTAYFDDFTMTKVESPGNTPLLRVTPESFGSFTALVNETDSTKSITVSGEHISKPVNLSLEGTGAAMFRLAKSSITSADFPSTIKIYYKPTAAGSHRAELLISSEGAEEIRVVLNAIASEVGGKPTITVNYENLKPFTAKPGEKMEQIILVSASNMDDYVYVRRDNDEANNFKISGTMLPKNFSNLEFKISYEPRAEGEHSAFITFHGGGAAQVKVPVSGICSAEATTDWVETFENLPTDKEFGDFYANATKGSWHFVNAKASATENDVFHGSRSIRMATKAIVGMDFDIYTGIGKVSLMAAARKDATGKAQWKLEKSSDFGLTWVAVGETQTVGEKGVEATVEFTVNQVGPVRLRLVRTDETPNADMNIDDLLITSFEGEPLSWDKLANLNEANPLEKMNEGFNNTRQNKPVVIKDWKNFIIKGERPWWTFNEKDPKTGEIINYTAKATAYNSLIEAEDEYEMWMITPALKGNTGGSKLVTFRVMGDFMTEQHSAKVECYYIEKDGDSHFKSLIEELEMPSIPDENGDWREFHLDLSKSELADVFFMGFRFTGLGGKSNSTVYYIDDVSYGRTDIPSISSDVNSIKIEAMAFKVEETGPIHIKGMNLTEDISVTIGGANPSAFKASTSVIPKAGGELVIFFIGENVGLYSADLRFSSKGAADYIIPMEALVTPADPTIVVAAKDTAILLNVKRSETSATSHPIIANPFFLTKAISINIEGSDKDMFSVSKTSIPSDGLNESFTVTFTPKPNVKDAKATIRLKSEGAADVLISVKGKNEGVSNELNSNLINVILWKEGGLIKIEAKDMLSIEVYSLDGRKVYTDPIASDYKEFTLDSESTGLYLVKVKTTKGTKIVRVVK